VKEATGDAREQMHRGQHRKDRIFARPKDMERESL